MNNYTYIHTYTGVTISYDTCMHTYARVIMSYYTDIHTYIHTYRAIDWETKLKAQTLIFMYVTKLQVQT